MSKVIPAIFSVVMIGVFVSFLFLFTNTDINENDSVSEVLIEDNAAVELEDALSENNIQLKYDYNPAEDVVDDVLEMKDEEDKCWQHGEYYGYHGYSSNPDHVCYEGVVIEGADPESFSVEFFNVPTSGIQQIYGVDKEKAYSGDKVVGTFQWLDNERQFREYLLLGNDVYYYYSIMPGESWYEYITKYSDDFEIIGDSYSKDATNVYYEAKVVSKTTKDADVSLVDSVTKDEYADNILTFGVIGDELFYKGFLLEGIDASVANFSDNGLVVYDSDSAWALTVWDECPDSHRFLYVVPWHFVEIDYSELADYEIDWCGYEGT